MRTETIELFSFDELSDEAKKKACEQWRSRHSGQSPTWDRETLDSLKALFSACRGIELTDYSLGAYCYSYVKFSFTHEEVSNFTGRRAMAWIENNLLSDLRIPWTGKKRWELAKYGAYYRAGKIEPCPFTGYCFDDNLLEDLIKHIRKGRSLWDSFARLANLYTKTLEAEYEYEQTAEYISDYLSGNSYEFYADGSLY